MDTANVYNKLYNDMKARFTVVGDGEEYTLGEYMLMKAGKKSEKTNLPVAKSQNNQPVVAAFFKYVNDKLTVKKPPVKDKIIKAFPFRTTAAAFLSAIVACTLIVTSGTAMLRGTNNAMTTTVENVEMVETEDNLDYIAQK
jgi:hypothetical protein